VIEDKELTSIQQMLIMTRGNQSEVARLLGVQRSTVRYYLNEENKHIVIKTDGVYSLFTRVGA
jgi:DNA-binding protein Fis